VKKDYRSGRRRVHRPWVTEPGMWVQYDFGDGPVIDGVKTVLFCAWLQALLRLHAAEGVADAYDAYVQAAKKEAGAQMHEAWEAPPVTSDTAVNLHVPLPRGNSQPRETDSSR